MDHLRDRAFELTNALRRAGHDAEPIPLPFIGKAGTIVEEILACQLLDLDESMGRRIDRLISLSFPAYLTRHPANVTWLMNYLPDVYELWEGPHGRVHQSPHAGQIRRLVRSANSSALSQARSVFAPSEWAALRCRDNFGIEAGKLSAPPSHAERYKHRGDGDFFLLAASATTPLRDEIVYEAMKKTRYPVQLRVLTSAQPPEVDRSLEGRVTCLNCSGEERYHLIGTCLAMLTIPVAEPDGMVALEAMLSSKAIVTFNDSGGLVELIEDNATGFVCPPYSEAVADILDRLWEDRVLARNMGRAALTAYQELNLNWDDVVRHLLL